MEINVCHVTVRSLGLLFNAIRHEIKMDLNLLLDEQESVELKSSGESKAEINDNFLSFGSSIDTHAIMTSKKITFW